MQRDTKVAKNVSEYLNILKESGYMSLYRGQEEDWPLIPSIGRVNVVVIEGLLEVEQNILESLKLLGHPFFKGDITNESDWILHAQHYGLPSRLLDFTTNPLKALYFAVESNSESDGVVFTIDEYGDAEFPSLEIKSACFYRPTHINSRITAQESAFAVFPLEYSTLEMKPLDEYTQRSLTQKVIIPAESKEDIKKDLSILGINKMSIYPGIEGIVEKIKEECGLT
ncbi:MAG: FRG domain-containing protein [Colwellia sp.]|nr:FRG domain-containing protein [Colwellia sp.]MCW8864134.1 FRG domain-containing protein [Colwellia sp.]MCW9083161.1 FRG domain-containing protein [Colwellia sp.]